MEKKKKDEEEEEEVADEVDEVKKRTFTVDEAIEKLGFGKFQVLILIYAGMSWMAEAMEMMLLSFVGPAVEKLWELSPQQESNISSVVFAGMMVGAYSWGVLSDAKGRRTGFFATAVLTFIAGFLSSFAQDYYMLLVLRMFVGVGLGGGPVVSSWCMEFVPSPNRGLWMVIFSTFWTVGSIAEALLAWLIMPTLGWRWLLAASSLPLLILLVFYPFVPESPKYYAAKGNIPKALDILNRISAVNKKILPSGHLILSSSSSSSLSPSSSSSHEEELEVMHLLKTKTPSPQSQSPSQSQSQLQLQWFSSFTALLSPSLLRSTLLLWLVFFATSFIYYGLVLLTTQLSSDDSCSQVSSSLSSTTAVTTATTFANVLITSFAELPGLAVAAAVVDRYGRKATMCGMYAMCGLFMLPLLVPHPQNTTFFLFGARACIMGAFTILYIYAPEVYPTSMRTTGLGTANSMGRIGGMLCPIFAVALVRNCHHSLAVSSFAGMAIVASCLVLFFPYETKGKALSDSDS